MFKKTLFVIVLALMVPAMSFAQGITTAALNGTITDQSGEPLAGANVVAVHEPTGGISGAASRSDGRFNIAGVRVGGPYTVTASFIGYKTAKQENVYLAIGQDLRVTFSLVEEALELAEIVTVAERDAIFTASNTGTINNITTAQIERLPNITRSIAEFTRLTPMSSGTAGGTSIAGKNNRQNNFQVDGAVMNDAFGLNSDGLPTGSANAQPISMDAIQEFQVQIAPFDVRSGSFAGGLINAVTRSGTNQFTGSAYYFGQNDSFVGDLEDPITGESVEFGNFDDFQGGFRFGGPLVQDKVFFFINGEIRRRDFPDTAGLLGSGSSTEFPITAADMQRIIDIAKSPTYDYDPGGFAPFTNETDDQKFFARLDFNLSQQHRLTIRHSYVDADRDDGIDRDNNEYTLESNQFTRDNQTNSTVLQLNSTFGNNLANEFRIGYTTIRDKRTPLFAPAPEIQINIEDAGGSDIGEVRLGVERFSQQNALEQDTFEFTNNLLYFTGDHTLTFGTHNEFISFDNLFIQDAFGAYEFDVTLENLRNGTDIFTRNEPTRFLFTQSLVPGVDEPRAAWDYIQLGFYVQDEWKPSPKLNLTFGLRADIPLMPDEPLENPLVETTFGLSTTDVPNGNILWSPRFGFNYDLSEDRTTQIRGGGGLFAGLPPAVWLSNAYSNTGVDFARVDVATFRGQTVPAATVDPNNQPDLLGTAPTSDIVLLDKDFKLPQVFRTNLAIDHQLPQGLIGTLEVLYSKNVSEVFFRNLNQGDPNNPGAPTGTNVHDGRPDYGGDRVSTDFNSVIVLDNTSEGHQFFVTARLQKQLNRGPLPGLFGSLSYTLGESEDINSGRSSRAISNWQFNETNDPNGEKSSTSDFEVRHRIVGDLSYNFNYGRGLGTTISMFYEGRSGSPFSYMYDNNVNGDQSFGDNDLVFVPASRSDVSDQVSDEEWALIETFINSSDALKDARGKIFPRNSARTPWQNRLDLRIAPKIPSIGGQNFELTLDFRNFLNLLNNDWGEVQFVNFDADNFLDFDGYDSAGKPIVTLDPRDSNEDGVITQEDSYSTADFSSRWQMQFGIRYTF
ncbi:TonB-dependent receptor [candidate division KSB1 bacterium]|nr:TonB-dependent receptor [candidate division KSB1 bacterium]